MLLLPNFQRSFSFNFAALFEGAAKVCAVSIPTKYFLVFLKVFLTFIVPGNIGINRFF
jgi:hypothetical protein